MPRDTDSTRGDSSVLAPYLDRILELRQKGETVDVEELAGGDRELARELEVMLSTLDVVEGHAAVSAGTPLAAGRMLGDYRVERELGRGGMGVVFLAEDTRLERRVALKFLPVQAALDASLRERFRREARAAGRLHHPNIVAVHGLGEQEGLLYLILQYVEGLGLDRVARSSDLDPKDVARLGVDLADALSYAHSHGIVHRDVKPANVLVDGEGMVHITDFGLCELRGEEQLTRTDAVLGTPRYMAPEQLLGRSSAQSDVYGLGATLYEALTGRPPYDDERSGRASYEQRLAHPPMRPRRIVPGLPRALEAIVLKAMAPLPEQRYTGARALGDDLLAFLENRPVDAQPPGPADILRLAYRRNRLASWVLGLAAAALAVLTLVYVQGLRTAQRNEERRAYVATIAAASAAFQANDEDLAARSLEASPERLRSWEWRHLSARLGGGVSRVAYLGQRAYSLELSPDGRWIAVGLGEDLVLVDRTAPERRFEFEHDSDVWGMAFSSDGRFLASCDHTGRVLRIALGEEPALAAESDLPLPKPRCPTFDPSGERIAVGFYDGSVRLYDLDWNPLGERAVVHGSRVYELAFTPDGRELLSCGADGTLRALELSTGANRLLARHDDLLHDLDLHAEEPWVLVGGEAGLVEIWNYLTGERVQTWRMTHASIVTDVHFAGDGLHVVAPGDETTISVWQVGRDEEVQRLSIPHGAVYGLAWDPFHRTVLGAGRLGSIHELDVFHPGGVLRTRPHVGRVSDVAFSADGTRLATTGRDTNVCVLDGRTGHFQALLQEHLEYGTAVSFGPQDRWLASGDEAGRVILWDVATGAVRADTGAVERHVVRDLDFTTDGERLLVARDGHPLEELAIPALTPVSRPGVELPDDVSRVAVSHDHVVLVRGQVLELRSSRDLVLTRSIEVESAVAALAFHPHLPRLVTGARDGLVVTWDLGGGAPLASFELRPGAPAPARKILDLAFHADGHHLAVVTERMTPLLVDPDTGEELLLLSGLSDFATSVALSPDGRAIACGGSVGDVVLWDELDAPARRSAADASRAQTEASAELEAFTSPAGLTRRVRALCANDELSPEQLYHGFLMSQELFHNDVSDTTGYFLMNRIQARRGQPLAHGRLESLAHSGAEPRDEIFLTFLLSLLDRGEKKRALTELAERGAPDLEALAELFSPAERARLRDLFASGS